MIRGDSNKQQGNKKSQQAFFCNILAWDLSTYLYYIHECIHVCSIYVVKKGYQRFIKTRKTIRNGSNMSLIDCAYDRTFKYTL